jgi:transcriptional regulator with XRE-family HTH domain
MKKVRRQSIDSIRESMGDRIKQLRLNKGITQGELAKAIGSSQNRIPEIESGKTKNIDTYIACLLALEGKIMIQWNS